MCKFIRIKSYKALQNNEKYSKYIEKINELYQKYSQFLFDDFFVTFSNESENFITIFVPYFWIITDRNDNFAGFVFLTILLETETNFLVRKFLFVLRKNIGAVLSDIVQKFFSKCVLTFSVFTKLRLNFIRKTDLLKGSSRIADLNMKLPCRKKP